MKKSFPAGWSFTKVGLNLALVYRSIHPNGWCINDRAWSNQWLGREIKRVVTQDDPFAEILLNLWERDLL